MILGQKRNRTVLIGLLLLMAAVSTNAAAFSSSNSAPSTNRSCMPTTNFSIGNGIQNGVNFSSGSSYASQPYTVGCNSPMEAANSPAIRRVSGQSGTPGGGGGSQNIDTDAPIGPIPFLFMALLAIGLVAYRKIQVKE